MTIVDSVLKIASELELTVKDLPVNNLVCSWAISFQKYQHEVFIHIFCLPNGQVSISIYKEIMNETILPYTHEVIIIETEENVTYFKIISSLYHYFK